LKKIKSINTLCRHLTDCKMHHVLIYKYYCRQQEVTKYLETFLSALVFLRIGTSTDNWWEIRLYYTGEKLIIIDEVYSFFNK